MIGLSLTVALFIIPNREVLLKIFLLSLRETYNLIFGSFFVALDIIKHTKILSHNRTSSMVLAYVQSPYAMVKGQINIPHETSLSYYLH